MPSDGSLTGGSANMILPEYLNKLIRFIASPLGIVIILAWMLGGIWSAYRRLKSKHNRDKH